MCASDTNDTGWAEAVIDALSLSDIHVVRCDMGGPSSTDCAIVDMAVVGTAIYVPCCLSNAALYLHEADWAVCVCSKY